MKNLKLLLCSLLFLFLAFPPIADAKESHFKHSNFLNDIVYAGSIEYELPDEPGIYYHVFVYVDFIDNTIVRGFKMHNINGTYYNATGTSYGTGAYNIEAPIIDPYIISGPYQ